MASFQNIEEALQNVVIVFRYHRMLPSEPENPWTDNSDAPKYSGSFRKFGLFAQLDERKVLEQMVWRYYANRDNSSDHEIYYFDGEKTYTWSGWNNSGIVSSGEHQELFGMGSVSRYFYSFGQFPPSHLVNSEVISNVSRITDASGESLLSFDLSDSGKPQRRDHIVLSETHDFFLRLKQYYFKDRLSVEQKITEFMPLPEDSLVNLRWFPKKATHWASYVSPRLGEPLPPTEAEILRVAVGTLKPEDIRAFAYPRGCLLLDGDLKVLRGSTDEHVPPSELTPLEIPSYFPKLGLGVTLEEAKSWVDSH